MTRELHVKAKGDTRTREGDTRTFPAIFPVARKRAMVHRCKYTGQVTNKEALKLRMDFETADGKPITLQRQIVADENRTLLSNTTDHEQKDVLECM